MYGTILNLESWDVCIKANSVCTLFFFALLELWTQNSAYRLSILYSDARMLFARPLKELIHTTHIFSLFVAAFNAFTILSLTPSIANILLFVLFCYLNMLNFNAKMLQRP